MVTAERPVKRQGCRAVASDCLLPLGQWFHEEKLETGRGHRGASSEASEMPSRGVGLPTTPGALVFLSEKLHTKRGHREACRGAEPGRQTTYAHWGRGFSLGKATHNTGAPRSVQGCRAAVSDCLHPLGHWFFVRKSYTEGAAHRGASGCRAGASDCVLLLGQLFFH